MANETYYEIDKDNNIIDILTGNPIQNTPEERVRQNYIWILINDYGYPKHLIRKEVAIQSGRKLLLDEEGNVIRADIIVYLNKAACENKDQGRINFVVECKKPTATEGYAQLVSYIFNTSASGGVWTNGDSVEVYERKTDGNQRLEEALDLPRHGEGWDGDTIPTKDELPRPKNVRFLLATCHNKLYGRGMENADFDLTMDMVRILLAKIQDETNTGSTPAFWVTKKDFKTAAGRREAAKRIRGLFRQYADQYPDVFDATETIMVGDDCIVEAAGVLQGWSLAARSDEADDWDLMGETYEQFTHINLKRQQGQYFTNRLVIDMIMDMLDPEVGDRILDPAGGGGGFATAAFRHLRRKVVATTTAGSAQRERQISGIKESVYLVEIASRLVKIAKCAMLLTGDGQSGMTRGNTLGAYENLDPWITSHCRRGTTNAPNVIATNPPSRDRRLSPRYLTPKYFGDSNLDTHPTLMRMATHASAKSLRIS